jgi:TonB family protein
VYPAAVQGVTGVVTVQLTVDTNGRVAESRPIQFMALGASQATVRDRSVAQAFVASVIDAVNQWVYEPPGGRPLTFLMAVVVRSPSAAASADVAADELVLADSSALAKTRAPKPVYPMLASMKGIQGVIVLEVTIGPDGKVLDGRVSRAIPYLDQAALDVMAQWEFDPQPVLAAGQQKNVVAQFMINFALR